MKKSFMQFGYTRLKILSPLCCIVFFLVLRLLIDRSNITYLEIRRCLFFCAFLLFIDLVILIIPKVCTRVYVDETGMVGKSYGKERWRCRWWDIGDVKNEYKYGNARSPAVFIISFDGDGKKDELQIEVTPSSRKILANYCSREKYKEAFKNGKMILGKSE